MSSLTLDNVSKWYGPTAVLKNVSLSVALHERVVICGPSGSGKSTLLRCINGLETHQRGRIQVGSTELTQHARTLQSIRRQVGMVFQSFHLFPHLTVLQNCTLAPAWAGKLAAAPAQELAMRYLQKVHVAEHAEKYPRQLSGGQQQRVAIARALCMKPEVLLFDEPTSALDPEMVKEVLDVIMALAADGVTMLCVTHELGFARRLADRIVFMDHGEIIEQGKPAELLGNPRTERLQAFLGQVLPR
jgi:general L-amino acid transport system ATP-binding protein